MASWLYLNRNINKGIRVGGHIQSVTARDIWLTEIGEQIPDREMIEIA